VVHGSSPCGTTKDGVKDDKDKCSDTPLGVEIDTNGCPIIYKIGEINFYLENSASMKGYLSKQTQFKDILSSFISDYNNINLKLISDSIKNYKDRDALFADIIQRNNITNGKSTQLDKIFENIANHTSNNDVSIFVSDCILSFTKAQRKNNEDASKTEAYKLRDDIKSTFTKLKDSGFVASVYAFNSIFYGNYFDYKDVPTDYTKAGIERPFYIWVIAKEKIIREFNKDLNNNSHFKPIKSLFFGQNNETISKYSILPSLMRTGENWEVNSDLNGITNIALNESNAFSVALNLENLPTYAQDTTYLMQNLSVVSSDNWAMQKSIFKSSNLNTKIIQNPEEVSMFNKSTHVISINFLPTAIHKTILEIKMPFKYDNWYEDGNWSCEDDSRGHDFTNKTFMFHKLIEGVTQAYDTKSDFINFSIKVEN
jgi:hypothetical protein